MTFELAPFEEKHLEEAAVLIARCAPLSRVAPVTVVKPGALTTILQATPADYSIRRTGGS